MHFRIGERARVRSGRLGVATPDVMGLHKLTAGDGYTYLTRQVAVHDATDRGHAGAVRSGCFAELAVCLREREQTASWQTHWPLNAVVCARHVDLTSRAACGDAFNHDERGRRTPGRCRVRRRASRR